ncbi:ATP-binding protein [Spirochaeta lutea]|uniref:histidine kinase n=1 Tax=Spirochaeta lutea TaxID=1480694 RepID=A0A098R4B4_9SPIO|nr:ATP-binding protein [Spirochaeta lutea]KGE73607.1 hypothetical protein DC28_02890 [Spirochaeta lutea]
MIGIEKTQGLRRTYLHYILILFLSLLFVTLAVVQVSLVATTSIYRDQISVTLGQIHNTLALHTADGALTRANIQELIHGIVSNTSTRVTLIDWDGTVLADTQANPQDMDNHRFRPEIQDAYSTGNGSSIRFSNTIELDQLYYAERISLAIANIDSKYILLRVSIPLSGVVRTRNALIRTILLISIPTMLLSLFLAILEIRRINKPVAQIVEAAKSYQEGNLQVSLSILRPWEFAQIAWSMKSMATDLIKSLETARAQRDEINTLLQAIQEPVILVDDMQRILQVNEKALQLAGKSDIRVQGIQLLTVLRNSELASLLDRAIDTGSPQLDSISFFSDEERWYLCRILPIPGADQENRFLIMLYDETDRRRSEQQRRDFISNAAHELRTPLTVLRGYIEGLNDSSGSPQEHGNDLAPVLLSQTKRLEHTLENLFSLVRVWQSPMGFDCIPVQPILQRVLMSQKARSDERQVTLKGPETSGSLPQNSIQVFAQGELIELALSHLIRNAIEASPPGGTVRIWTETGTQTVDIVVHDEGAGIEPRDQDSIFQEFYRTPRDRPRYPGSGMGLTIVREIAALHRGRISLQSHPGHGSQFVLTLPKDKLGKTQGTNSGRGKQT